MRHLSRHAPFTAGSPMQRLDPLILTAAFDARAADTFQKLRDRHFPADRNIVPAHLTLFHHLPGAEQRRILADLRDLAAPLRPFGFSTTAPRFLGRGCALGISADPLVGLRDALAKTWSAWLTAQDRQKFQPHVTVQNKVAPGEARALCDDLQGTSVRGEVVGLDLWIYRGGPWEASDRIRFGAARQRHEPH